MWHVLLHILGIEPRTPSTAYNFWSGFGSDITELLIVGGIWRMVNCHEDGCWRVGTKLTTEANGHHYRRCTRHHQQRHTQQKGNTL